eukprot:4231352-Lingulodinium_polyedra.AAC.1
MRNVCKTLRKMRSKRPFAAATARKSHARAPHARTACLARVKLAGVRFASRRGNERSLRPHRCATFAKRCKTL